MTKTRISKGSTLPSFNPMLSHRAAAAAAAALLSVAAVAVAAPDAQARTYHQVGSGFLGHTTHDNLTLVTNDGGAGYFATFWEPTYGAAHADINIGGGRGTYGVGVTAAVRYDAPANTTLSHVNWTNRANGLWGDWNTTGRDASSRFYAQIPTQNGGFSSEAEITGTWFELGTTCGGPSACNAAPGASTQLDSFAVELNDNNVPSASSPSGTLVADATLKGTAAIAYNASDRGAGLSKTAIFDGSTLVSKAYVDTNSGRCADANDSHYFFVAVPCMLSASPEASLDTTALPDGQHTLKVVVEDAAGNPTTVYGPVTKHVANYPPVNTALPAISDSVEAAKFRSPLVGQSVTFPNGGSWTGPNLAYAYAWLRCDLSGANCVQIPDTASLSYTPSGDDAGHTLKLASTAENAAESVTVVSAKSGQVVAPKSADNLTDKPPAATTAGATGDAGRDGAIVTLPGLVTSTVTSTTTHTLIGHVAGEPAGVACPGEKATLKFEHVKDGTLRLGQGKASTAQLLLTCTTTGKAITDAKLEIATKVGQQAAVASDVTTDGQGHAAIRLAKGASRGITVGYRMFADDTLARATATLKVLVAGKVSLKANKHRLRNGQAVTLRGSLAGGNVPRRGVTLAVQWKDGKRWRPFAQIKTNKKGQFAYAYKFTRTKRTVKYQLRVQVTKGQVDYPFMAANSKPVKVTVAP